MGCWCCDPVGLGSQWLDEGNVFTCDQTMIVTDFMCRAGRYSNGADQFRVVFYEFDLVEEELGDEVGTSNLIGQSDIPWHDFGDPLEDLAEVHFPFSDYEGEQVILFEDSTYCAIIERYSGTSINIWRDQASDYGSCDAGTTEGMWTTSDTFDDTKWFQIWITGYEVKEPEVVTIGAEIRTDGSVWLSGWTDVFGDEMECGFLLSETESVVDAGAGLRLVHGEVDPDETRYFFDHRVVSILSDVTYYYRAWSELNGSYFYGAVKSFQRLASDILPELNCQIITNTVDLVEFETSIIGIPDETSWNLTLYYGRSISECWSHNYSEQIELNVTEDGVFYVEMSGTDFDYGAKYWYYACGEESEGSTVCSPTRSFVVYDPDQPTFMNWITGWTGISFSNMWWVIILVALFVIWLIAAKTRWWWMGVIGTGVAMVALITYGYVNAWVVVLLCIIVGWIIFKLVFRKAGGTSS